MKLKQMFHRFNERTKSFWNTFRNYTFTQKATSIWKSGKMQSSSRITYDVVWNVILFFLMIGFVAAFFIGGLGAGYFASLVDDEEIRSYADMEKDIYNYEETSKLYFADNIYIGDVNAELYREETSLDEISPTLIQAVVATEDEYFEEHKGIVPKAVFRALFQEVTGASTQSGGSTLTQQLIKNQILTNEVSFERKAKEMLLAMRLERFFEKDEILEAYLNIVPYGRNSSGGNIAGIQTAAQGIFGINADEVNLAQAAYLAGLPQSPSYYTPFKNTGGKKSEEGLEPGLKRMQTVLNRMLDMEYITEEEYEEALNYDIVADFIDKKESPHEEYPLLTTEIQERAKKILIKTLADEDGYTLEDLTEDEDLKAKYSSLAQQALQSNGFKIHSTIDKEIYDAFQEVAKNYEYYGHDTETVVEFPDGDQLLKQYVQAGGILIENSTGRVISFLGSRKYSEEDQLNYATNAKRQIGSTSKPLVVYAPAMELGEVQPGSPLPDFNITIPNPGGKPWSPKNYGGGTHGLVSARQALASSYNIPAAVTYMKIINQDPAQYLEKMGITSLSEGDHHQPSLALGASDFGITVEETVNAYSTFGNNGKFADAYWIEKITTADGEVVYEHEPEPVEVFSPQTTYLTVDMMRDVISRGTAGYLNSQLKHRGIDWAGKTGTSQEYGDAWFIATNPNVTFGTWMGYEYQDSIYAHYKGLSYSQRNIKLWAELINKATDIKPELLAPSENFKTPDAIVSRSYCSTSGLLPSDLCKEAGLIKSDIFNAKFVPTKEDDSLIDGDQVIIDGKPVPAGSETPDEFTMGDGLMFNPDWLKRNNYDNVAMLYPRSEADKWQRIGAPNGSVGSISIENDGKAPGAPGSAKKTGGNLTWDKPSTKDVVGYRVYRAAEPGGDFKLVGNTTDTTFPVGDSHAIYYVKAVDYFGLESTASNEVIIGQASESDSEKKDEEKTEETNANQNEEQRNQDNKDQKKDKDDSNKDNSNNEKKNDKKDKQNRDKENED
ncbi:transglycosylase domain-containing protein [Oceanobacillus halophilus]|uniref:Penicillin-binding protein n=1 Tax=Oceanobacillus halophilus TaxID=930130 RepID=A0A494ZVI4_9BACI|nr:transglycosylase domain-containing protein [Oceanobacillus halophilus]RKQ30542.1 penicillin-binding protein [Oceanobacillus halophilus]